MWKIPGSIPSISRMAKDPYLKPLRATTTNVDAILTYMHQSSVPLLLPGQQSSIFCTLSTRC